MFRFRQRCSHISQINDVKPSAQGCEECLRTGDTWMHLRECLSCGYIDHLVDATR